MAQTRSAASRAEGWMANPNSTGSGGAGSCGASSLARSASCSTRRSVRLHQGFHYLLRPPLRLHLGPHLLLGGRLGLRQAGLSLH